ncbi:hypothetical protein MKW98_002315, partial [Papaver atlanticum]
ISNPKPIVAFVAGAYVKQYLGQASLSSTTATKIYFDLDIPEVLHVRESLQFHIRTDLPTEHRHVKSPSRLELGTIRQTNPVLTPKRQFPNCKKQSGNLGTMYGQVLNKKICNATAIGISIEKGWYYLGCLNCTTKLVGNIGDHWCPRCKVQIDEP